ncbi:MAG TPA: VOC family protein, partial [Conexibacter sp.]|nr:VOC family protein [Conexibacter sp.]
MVTRVGHIALHVADLDAAVDFQQQVLGMVETERLAGVSYLTCNERHHELILIQAAHRRGYDHLALEVSDAATLEP